MVFFSGRIDMTEEEETMIEFFNEIVEGFNADYFIFTFEDKTKSNIPCKPHYHYLIEIDSVLKPDTVRRHINKILSNYGVMGDMKSIKQCELNEKTLNYILKQGEIVFTSLEEEESNKLLKQSKDYNEEIKHYSHDEIIQKVINECIDNDFYRESEILIVLHRTIYAHNKSQPYNYKCSFPTKPQFEQLCLYIQNKCCDEEIHLEAYCWMLGMTPNDILATKRLGF